ncbi:MAG: hypothetical protein P8X70_03395, partial [Nanoarchaeota archaeon]
QKDNLPNPGLLIELDIKNYLTSAEVNCLGFFVKKEEIRGDSSSAMKKMELSQIGYKRNFLILDTINLNPSLNLVFGNYSSKDIENDADNNLQGVIGDLSISTNNKKGLNLASRIAGNISWTKDSALFHDFLIEAGVSYKSQIKELSIEPYLIGQLVLFPGDLDIYEFVPMLNEIRAGVNLDLKISDNTNLSIEPYALRKIWEYEFGGDIELENENFGINAGGYGTISNYDFCPDKYGLDIEAHLKLKGFLFGITYELERTDYDGEIENQHSFNIQGSVKS